MGEILKKFGQKAIPIAKEVVTKVAPGLAMVKTGLDHYNTGVKAYNNTKDLYRDGQEIYNKAYDFDQRMKMNPELSKSLNDSVDRALKRQFDIEKLSYGTGGKIRTRRHHKKSKRVKRKGASRRKRRY
jgi:hypothetical protein